MDRAVMFVVAVVAAGWTQASAAQLSTSNSRGEAWISPVDASGEIVGAETPKSAKTSASRTIASDPSGSRWPTGNEEPKYGSGLEEDAPRRTPNVFLQSGLEGLTSLPARPQGTGIERFGSGLEDVWERRNHELDNSTAMRSGAPQRRGASSKSARFGSGLEDGAPARPRNVLSQSGF